MSRPTAILLCLLIAAGARATEFRPAKLSEHRTPYHDPTAYPAPKPHGGITDKPEVQWQKSLGSGQGGGWVEIANLDGDSLAYTEGDAATAIDQGGDAIVADIDSADFNTGNQTATITAGEDAAEDILSFDTSGTVALSGTTAGSNVSVGGNVVGTLANTITAGADLVVNFTSAFATPAAAQALVR